MNVIPTDIEGVLIIEPQVFKDERGYFLETYHTRRFKSADLNNTFVQDNLSFSVKNTLRGLHFQVTHPQAKLIQVISGEIFDVAVDIRRESPTFGRWVGISLTGHQNQQLFIPEGFAHGFCVLSEGAHVSYKCSDYYDADDEGGILWSDPTLKIDWPLKSPIISDKDSQLPCITEVFPDNLQTSSKRS